MATRLHDERRFEVDPDELVGLWKTPAFQLARSRALGTLEATCVCEGDTVIVEETRDTGWKPHLYETRLTTRWAGREAKWELVRLAGPGDAGAHGTLVVRPTRSGARLVLEGRLEVRVPVLGGLIERLARRALSAEREVEARFVKDWLAGQVR